MSDPLSLEPGNDCRSSDRLLQSTLRHFPGSMAIVSADLRFLRVNEAFAQALAHPVEGLIGKRMYEVFPGTEAQIGHLLSGVLATGTAYSTRSFPFSYTDEQGTHDSYWDFTLNPILGEDGTTQGILFQGFEASARVCLEQAAHQKETPFSTLFERVPIATAIVGKDGRLGSVNEAFQSMLGYSAAELRDKPFDDLTHPDDVALDQQLPGSWIEVKAARTRAARRYMRKDGGIIRGVLTLAVIRAEDGSPRFAIAMIQDITEHLAAREALERQAELLDLTQDAIFVLNLLDGTITHWNKGGERMYGWSTEEALGRTTQDLLKTEFPCPLSEIMDELNRTGYWSGELSQTRRNGDPLIVSSRWALQRDRQGRPLAILELNTDITERKKAERQLKAAFDELMAAERYKDEWLSIISHELRTPLNFIMGFASILSDEIAGPLSPQQHEYLAKIATGSERMLGLVNNLLDMSRLAAGKFEVIPSLTEYQGVVGEVLATLRPLADRKGILLDGAVSVPGEVWVDGLRIVQVLTNLVGNALKFTPAGGAVDVSACVFQGELLTEISDSGIGIAPEDVPKLFKQFKQLNSTATRKAGGTGLGLAISKAIVEAHGGRIGVDSKPGNGSKFWFALPLKTTDG